MISRMNCISKSIGGTVNSGGKVGGIVNQGGKEVEGELDKPQTIYVKELEFKSYREFPTVGNSEFLYIDTQTNTIYRFDSEQNIYVSCGRDMDDVETIICKLKEE